MTKYTDKELEIGLRVQVIWDDEDKTIIRFIFEANWTWDEYTAAQQVAYDLAATVRYKVGVLVEEGPTLPPEMLTSRRDFTLFTNRHPNVDVFVFVLRTSILRGIVSLLMKLYAPAASLVVLAPTLEEGRRLLKARLQAAS
jgi:hypothetical protein